MSQRYTTVRVTNTQTVSGHGWSFPLIECNGSNLFKLCSSMLIVIPAILLITIMQASSSAAQQLTATSFEHSKCITVVDRAASARPSIKRTTAVSLPGTTRLATPRAAERPDQTQSNHAMLQGRYDFMDFHTVP